MDNIFFDLNKLKHLGRNVIIGKTVRIRKPELVSIGDNVIIDDFTYISCDLVVGAYTHIASNVTISGGGHKVTIGKYCGIATGVSIHPASSNYMVAELDYPTVPEDYRFGGLGEDIVISDYVLLGTKSVVLPGVFLPEGFASAALTVIRKKEYKPWTLYGFGHECKEMVYRPHLKFLEQIKKIEKMSK
jgi:acetyltransferase-like isoleucine patch superfamily enzyme